jgi:predicted small lipoprotein YifL
MATRKGNMKKRVAALVLVPFLVVVAACGGDDGGLSLPTVTDAPAEDPRTQTELSADQDAAKSAVLVLSDFPTGEGWEARDHEDNSDLELQEKLAACIGVPVEYFSGTTAHGQSEDFVQGDDEVSSESDVLPTVEDAKAYVGIIARPEARACYEDLYGSFLQDAVEDGVNVDDINVGSLAVATHGDETAGMRITVALSRGDQDAELFVDYYVVRDGRSVAALLAQTTYSPLSDLLADALLVALADRLDAAP